jgi:predicted dinucleotide-binding enzyme
LGIFGAGRVGSSIARRAAAQGIDVKVATAKDPSTISLIIELMAPGAQAVTSQEAAQQDIVLLAVPMHKFTDIDPHLLDGKIVIDAMNYWAPTDGTIESFENQNRSTSEIVQEHFAGAKVVKTLNHIGYHEFESYATESGDPNRRALAVAGDDEVAKVAVSALIEHLGYDAADIGPLSAGVLLQPGSQIFSGPQTLASVADIVDRESVRAA